MKHVVRFIPLIILLLLMGIVYFFGINEYISWEVFKEHRDSLKEFVSLHPIGSSFAYMGIYALLTALSIPAAFLISMIGGFLFPQPLSTLLVVIGATFGATILFLVAKYSLKDVWGVKFSKLLKPMQKGFQKNAMTYLLILRLLPIFPFWLVNIAPAFFNVAIWVFVWTTFLGIIPGAFVYTQAGRGIDAIFEGEGPISFWNLLNTEMIIALIGIVLLAFIPMIVKYIVNHK